MRLRRFTPAGLTRFGELLASAEAGELTDVPADLLTAAGLTEELPAGEIDPGAFGVTRLEAAAHLNARLLEARLEEPERDAALWAWLSLLAFDAVCPRDRKGRHRPGARARYVPVIGESRRVYRHRLLGPYLVFRSHQDDPYRALCLLCQPLMRPGGFVERFAARPRLVACRAAVGVATILYCDGGSIKRGATASVERLSDVLMQLDRTYDLYGMTAEGLLALLPKEFDAFRSPPRRRS